MSALCAGGRVATPPESSAPWAAPESHQTVVQRLRARVAVDVVLASWRLDPGPRWRLLQRALGVFDRLGLDQAPIQRALREDWARPWSGRISPEAESPSAPLPVRSVDEAEVQRLVRCPDSVAALRGIVPRSRRERLAWQLVGRLLLSDADPFDPSSDELCEVESRRAEATRVLHGLRPSRARQRAELEFAKAALRRRDAIDCFLRLQRITDAGLRAEAGWLARAASAMRVPESPWMSNLLPQDRQSVPNSAPCDLSAVAPTHCVAARIGVLLRPVDARRLMDVHRLLEPLESGADRRIAGCANSARLILRHRPELVIDALRRGWSLAGMVRSGRADVPGPLDRLLDSASRLASFLPGPSRHDLWTRLLGELLTECEELEVAVESAMPVVAESLVRATEIEQRVLREGARSTVPLAVATCRELRFGGGSDESLSLQLRSMRAAGVGEAGVRRVAHWLERLPPDQGRWAEALRWLAEADPERAIGIFCGKQSALTMPSSDLEPVLRMLVERRAITRGMASAWLALRTALERQLESPSAAAAWVAELFEVQPGSSQWPPTELCTQLAKRDDLALVRCAALAQSADRLVTETRSIPDLARVLRSPPDLAAYSWHRPARVGRARPLTSRTWERIGAELEGIPVRISEQTIQRLAIAVGKSPSAAELLARIAEAGRAAERVAERAGIGLRWLDARRDPLTWLRFADVDDCCWASDHEFHRSSTLREVLLSFLDPLTFCWHIGTGGRRGEFRPHGFVLGGFAMLAGGRPAVVLNGIYMPSGSRRRRAAILDSVDNGFCRPLGIDQFGIANRHGGRGFLPPGFVRDDGWAERLRALTLPDGSLVTQCGEDAWERANTRAENPFIHWRLGTGE